jgi:phosphoglycolate phosphatase
MKDKPNILFDLDGTLIHSLPGIEASLAATLKILGKKSYEHETFMPLVGYPLNTVFEKLLGEDDPDIGFAVQTYRRYYLELGLPQTHPYDGTREMLGTLHRQNRFLYVVTARNEEVAKTILRDHRLDAFILSVRGERHGDGRETKIDLLAEIIREHHLGPAETVMVGDRRFDMDAAIAAGCSAVGVTYGYGSRKELIDSGAGVLAETQEELVRILME